MTQQIHKCPKCGSEDSTFDCVDDVCVDEEEDQVLVSCLCIGCGAEYVNVLTLETQILKQ
jgi:hypothetical protein